MGRPSVVRALGGALATLLLAGGVAFAGGDVQRVDKGRLDGIESLADGDVPDRRDGSVLLLQFWASWCHSCGSIMWDMDELASRYPEIDYIAISIDDEASAARAYLDKHPLYAKHPTRYFHDADKQLAESLDVKTVPSIFLVAGNGDVLLHKRGHLNGSDLRDFANSLSSAH